MLTKRSKRKDQDLEKSESQKENTTQTEPETNESQKAAASQFTAQKREPVQQESLSETRPEQVDEGKTIPPSETECKDPEPAKPPVSEPEVSEIEQAASTQTSPAEPEVSEPGQVAAPGPSPPQTEEESAPVMMQKNVPKEEIDRILRHHVWGAMGVGLVPMPLIDFVGIIGVQINLLRKLAQSYDVPFLKDKAVKIIGTLAATALPVVAAPPLASSLIKAVPFLGQTLGVITMPICSGAATYALGKVFIQHFASGGTFLSFDPDKVKAYYAEMYKEGQQVAKQLQQERTSG